MTEKITPRQWEASPNGAVKANGETVAMVYGTDHEQGKANTQAVARMIQAIRTVANIYPDNDHLEDVYEILETLP